MSVIDLNTSDRTASASGTDFPFTFNYDEYGQIKVYVDGSAKSLKFKLVPLTGEFVLLAAGDVVIETETSTQTAVKVRTGDTLSSQELLIQRETDLTQEHSYLEGDKYYATNNENVADKAIYLLQEHDDRLDKILHFERKTDTSGLVLILPTPEANKVLSWNATADEIEYVDATGPAGPPGAPGAAGGDSAAWKLLGIYSNPLDNIDGTNGFDTAQSWTQARVTFTTPVAGQYDFEVVTDNGTLAFDVTATGVVTESLTAVLAGAVVTNANWARINLVTIPGSTEDIHVTLS